MLDPIKGPISLIRHIAALRPGKITSPTASAKAAMRAIARRWLALQEEIHDHGQELERLVREKAPGLMNSHGISTMTAAEMLILVGDNPERIKSEAALAKLCGVCPIPASSGKTNRMRLNRGGNRKANAALYIVAVTRMRGHEATKAYVIKRTAQGKSKRECSAVLETLYYPRDISPTLCAKRRKIYALTNIGASQGGCCSKPFCHPAPITVQQMPRRSFVSSASYTEF
jgi:transposase